MKKLYQAPDFEVLKLHFTGVITASEPEQEDEELPVTPFSFGGKSDYQI